VVARGLPCKRGGEHFAGHTASVVTMQGSEQLLRPPALMHDTRSWYVVPGVRRSQTNSVSGPVYTVSNPEMTKQQKLNLDNKLILHFFHLHVQWQL
jgi:hypothetical protein